jgi:hypothetical protein
VEFQRDCELAMERKYQQALKGWEASLADSPTRTAEEIASLVAYFGCIYFADDIDAGRSPTLHSTCSHSSTRSSSGLACVRRCCSLAQSENEMGRLVCRGERVKPHVLRHDSPNLDSVNAGKTRGLSPMDWPTFDWQGFLAVEACMINFARECFSTYFLFIPSRHGEYLLIMNIM